MMQMSSASFPSSLFLSRKTSTSLMKSTFGVDLAIPKKMRQTALAFKLCQILAIQESLVSVYFRLWIKVLSVVFGFILQQ